MLILSIKNLFLTAVIFCIFGSIELNSTRNPDDNEKSKLEEWKITEKMKKYLNDTYPTTRSGLMNILEDWKTESLQKINDSSQNPVDQKQLSLVKEKFNKINIDNLISQMRINLGKNFDKSGLMDILEYFFKGLLSSSFSVSSKKEDKVYSNNRILSNALLEELEKAIQKESEYLNSKLSTVTKSKLTYLLNNFKLKISRVIQNFDKEEYIYSSVKQELKNCLDSEDLKKLDASFEKELNKNRNLPNPKNLHAYCFLLEDSFNKIFDKAYKYKARDNEEALRINYIVKAKRELSYSLSKSELEEKELQKELQKEFDKVDKPKIERYFRDICIKISSIKNNLNSDTYTEEKNTYNKFSLTKDNFEKFKTKFKPFLISAKKKINELNENFTKLAESDQFILNMENLIKLVQLNDDEQASYNEETKKIAKERKETKRYLNNGEALLIQQKNERIRNEKNKERNSGNFL